MLTVLSKARIFTGEAILEQHHVLVQNGFIIAVQPDTVPVPVHAQVVDLNGKILSAGLIDAQVYGGGGALFSSHPTVATLENLYQHHLLHGTTGFFATLPTHTPAYMEMAIEAARQFQSAHPDVLFGLHLEGPFLNAEKRGAHPAAYIQQPDAEKLRYWLERGKGVLKIMTVAPELLDAATDGLAAKYGVVLSAGHSNATYTAATAGFNRDITAATHLFNAMSPFGSREPGLVGAIFDHQSVRASIIADGVHVDFASVRIAKRIMGERLFLITDAVDATGEAPYQFFKKANYYENAAGVLGGSALTMPLAIHNCVQQQICSFEEAIRMATLYPAQVLGVADQYGRIAVGYRSDFCVWAGVPEQHVPQTSSLVVPALYE